MGFIIQVAIFHHLLLLWFVRSKLEAAHLGRPTCTPLYIICESRLAVGRARRNLSVRSAPQTERVIGRDGSLELGVFNLSAAYRGRQDGRLLSMFQLTHALLICDCVATSDFRFTCSFWVARAAVGGW